MFYIFAVLCLQRDTQLWLSAKYISNKLDRSFVYEGANVFP